jgi:hypothetical protein
MLADHKIATVFGGIGAVALLGHVMLGPDVVPPAVGISGALLLAAVGVYLAVVGRRRGDRSERSSRGGRAAGDAR